jgi:hypothetical protein
MRHCVFVAVMLTLYVFSVPIWGQSPTATVNGLVRDPSGAVVPGADVQLINEHTNTKYPARTNREGIYSVPNLPPGTYRIQVSKAGFKTIVKPDIILNVLDARAINFDLPVGAVSETVTVEGGVSPVNTESATVSTVVDRQFAENLPMNGRSFQTLIQLTPGVVLTANSGTDTGQFSVNGQRASSNYWTVDGVSANTGISAFTAPVGNGLGGTLGSYSVLGGTNSLVSVDAMQEFRIQTSTYAPEFGRTPGGQISIATRSGTNQFHGTLFEYLRNDVLDANDWFSDNAGLPKARERQNDFGGTVDGPILRDRTFFFFSYEGLRLRLPQTQQTAVPDASFTPGGTTNSRQNAITAMQPYLNAFPLPNRNSPEIFVPCDPSTDPTCPSSGQKATGSAAFSASFSNPANLDAYSLRIDHKLNDKLVLFGRYNYSPSGIDQRGVGVALSDVSSARITTQTGTLGVTWSASPVAANEFRFNYSNTDASSSLRLDSFGGAVPLATLPFPSPFTVRDGEFFFQFLPNGVFTVGKNAGNRQRQFNLVDNVSVQRGSHGMKFGVDFRRLSPQFGVPAYSQSAFFNDVPDAETGNPLFAIVGSSRGATLLFRNLGVFAQDTWRVTPRLTLTYGLRWDVDLTPSSLSGPNLPAASGFNLSDLSKLALAPEGTPPFKTTYANVAPRIGLAYQISESADWQTVLRGGFGVFYDLASAEVGNNIASFSYPFGASNFLPGPPSGGTAAFPLSSANAAAPPITADNLISGTLNAFDPHLRLPYTLQWNVALEQALGKQQTITASYVGAAGRRLIQSAVIQFPNPNINSAQLVSNAATSDYDALQLQFQRHLSHGLQALASYTWSHSLDTASAGSFVATTLNALVASLNPNANRGPSDFDIRSAFSAGLTYDVPAPKINVLTNAILRGWSIENVLQARSAPPVGVSFLTSEFAGSQGYLGNARPDVVPGIPLYLLGSKYPGGKIINNTFPSAAGPGCVGPFCPPPTDSNGFPLRQGDLSRNALRGFGATQWDLAIHRDFPIRESIKLQFRAEMFNVLNHPNFGQPVGNLGPVNFPNLQFGQAIQMLGQSLSGGQVGAGGFNPLYQIGGPRSVQFALKLFF